MLVKIRGKLLYRSHVTTTYKVPAGNSELVVAFLCKALGESNSSNLLRITIFKMTIHRHQRLTSLTPPFPTCFMFSLTVQLLFIMAHCFQNCLIPFICCYGSFLRKKRLHSFSFIQSFIFLKGQWIFSNKILRCRICFLLSSPFFYFVGKLSDISQSLATRFVQLQSHAVQQAKLCSLCLGSTFLNSRLEHIRN